jgi:hypothetical protein
MQIVRDKKAVLSRVAGVATLPLIFGFMFRTLYLDWEQTVTYRGHLNYISFVPWVVGFRRSATRSDAGGDVGHLRLFAEAPLPGTGGGCSGSADQGGEGSQRSGLGRRRVEAERECHRVATNSGECRPVGRSCPEDVVVAMVERGV